MSFGMRCVLFAAALLLAVVPARADEAWVTVRSPDGALQYEAPGQLKIENYTDVDEGDPFRQAAYTSSSESAVVMVMYTDYDSTFVSVELNNAALGFMKGLKAIITGFSPRTYRRGPGDALPGVFVTGATENLECELWIIGEGRRTYLISACSRRGDSQTALKERLFNSIKITDIRTDADWTKVSDSGYHFLVPGKPKISQNRKTGDRIYVGRDAGLVVLGGSMTVPLPATSNPALDEALLDAAASGFMEGNRMTLVSREMKPYTLPSGKILAGTLFRTKDALTNCSVRLVLGQGRTYMLSACAVQGFEVDAKIKRVLDSQVIDEQ